MPLTVMTARKLLSPTVCKRPAWLASTPLPSKGGMGIYR
jgi:hypothetical protein